MERNLSIVIPTDNKGIKHLQQLLKSINSARDNKLVSQIVVISNKLTNLPKQCYKISEKMEFHYELNIKNLSELKNFGNKFVKGKWICFIDSDVEIERNYFTLLKKEIEKERYPCIIPHLSYRKSETKWGEYEGELDQESALNYIDKYNHSNITLGANTIIKREIFTKLGGFNKDYISAEDRELGHRMIKKGYKIRYLPNLKIYHKYPNSFLRIIKRKWWHGKGCGKLYEECPDVFNKSFYYWLNYLLDPIKKVSGGKKPLSYLLYKPLVGIVFFIATKRR